MYCPNCGQPAPTSAQFCPECGNPLPVAAAPWVASGAPAPTLALPLGDWLRRLPAIGAGIVIWCFFLPWVLVSCNTNLGGRGGGLAASGYEIASGDYAALRNMQQGLGSMFGNPNAGASSGPTDSTGARPALWLVLIIGAIGLLALNGRASGAAAALLAGLAGLLAMFVVAVNLLSYGQELSRQGLRLEFREGFWGTWLGFLWLTIAGAMSGRRER